VAVMLASSSLVSALAACGLHRLGEDQSLLNRCWTPQALAGTPRSCNPSAPISVSISPPQQEPLPQPIRCRRSARSIRSVTLPPARSSSRSPSIFARRRRRRRLYGRIVDLFARRGQATFFAGGKWMETHKERVEQLIAVRLRVGSHGLRHLDSPM